MKWQIKGDKPKWGKMKNRMEIWNERNVMKEGRYPGKDNTVRERGGGN